MPMLNSSEQIASSERSHTGRIANIKVTDHAQAKSVNSVEIGGALVSVATHSLNDSNMNSVGSSGVSTSDEQGIRAFLFKLLNSKPLFTTSDMVDQIEAFIQIKIDRCNQMINNFRDRLAKQEKENQKILLENKRLSTDQFNVQKAFKECLEQIKNDARREGQRQMYQNVSLLDPQRHQPNIVGSNMSEVASMISAGGHHTQKRVAKRL